MGIPDHLTCLLRKLYAGHEATVRTGHGTTDWFQIGKGVRQGCILSPCLFNSYAEHIMRNAGLDEAQAGIKIAGRNINKLRYADDTTLMVITSLFSVSMSLFLFCYVHSFIFQFPHISENIQYLVKEQWYIFTMEYYLPIKNNFNFAIPNNIEKPGRDYV